jgi:hypothetical protein
MRSDAPPFSQALNDRIVNGPSSAKPRSSKTAAASRPADRNIWIDIANRVNRP